MLAKLNSTGYRPTKDQQSDYFHMLGGKRGTGNRGEAKPVDLTPS